MLFIWIKFIVLIVIIIQAGYHLSRYGDIIGEKLGLSGSWIGVVLLAAVSSFPELFSGISASWLLHQPDLAIGNLYGACVMNMVVVALLSIMYQDGTIYSKIKPDQALSAALGILSLALAGLGLILSKRLFSVSLFDLGVFAIAVFIIYLIAQRMIFQFERREHIQSESPRYADVSTKAASIKFFIFAAIIMAAGIYLAEVADELSIAMNWGRSFVGTILMSIATTSPELVISVSALRMGHPGMALGNLFGSIIFNMGLIFVDDIFYKGSILADASLSHVFTAFLTITMAAVSLIAMLFRSTKKGLVVMSWDAAIILGLYLVGFSVLFRMSSGLG
jgi:cation:H+ antiporter